MSTKNNSVASQALLEMESIKNAVKEESKGVLKSLLSEAVKDYIREAAQEDDEDLEIIEDDAESENDDKKANGKESVGDVSEEDDTEMMDNTEQMPAPDAQEAPVEGEGEGDDWSNYQKYQVGDNTYDLTGEEDYEQVVKVYKLMKDDDQVIVKQNGNTIELQDNGTGADYVIDLGGDESATAETVPSEGEEMAEGCIKEDIDIAGLASDESDDDIDLDFEFDDEDIDLDFEFDDEDDNSFEFDDEDDNILMNDEIPAEEDFVNNFEGKKSRKTMKENKENLIEVEIHDYTDNYQSEDAIEGLSSNEPSKSGKSWEKGVPTGTKKPWAGETKSKGKPFGKKVDEEVEDEMPLDEHESKVRKRSAAKVRLRNNEKNPMSTKHASIEGSYKEVAESLMRENRALKNELAKKAKENKELKESFSKVRAGLHEQRVTNVNLAKITRLFVENAVSQNEKMDIINRFSNEAKTIEQSKALYESIDKQLKKGVKQNVSINEGSMTVNGSKTVNESKAVKSKDLCDTLDLIKRIERY